MPSEPTLEELKAEVAALRLELSRTQAPPLFTQEVKGAAPPNQPDLKTTQALQPSARYAVPLDLLRRNRSADPTVIQGQIDGLKSLIISGVNSAGYGDKRTEFRSLTDLRQILNGLEDDLAEALGARRRS
jgi:hypothetical protein